MGGRGYCLGGNANISFRLSISFESFFLKLWRTEVVAVAYIDRRSWVNEHVFELGDRPKAWLTFRSGLVLSQSPSVRWSMSLSLVFIAEQCKYMSGSVMQVKLESCSVTVGIVYKFTNYAHLSACCQLINPNIFQMN